MSICEKKKRKRRTGWQSQGMAEVDTHENDHDNNHDDDDDDDEYGISAPVTFFSYTTSPPHNLLNQKLWSKIRSSSLMKIVQTLNEFQQ